MSEGHIRIELERVAERWERIGEAAAGISDRALRPESARIEGIEQHGAFDRSLGLARTAGARAVERIEQGDVGVAVAEPIGPLV